MNFSEDVARTNVSDHFDEGDANFQYRVTYSVTPRNSEMHAELHLIKDRVEAVDWPEYTDKLTKMQPRLQGYIQLPAVTLSQADELKKDLNDLTESLQRGTIKYVTPIQLKARVRQLVLTTQLESGRLNPTLRAQALNTLGEQLDWIGDPEKASADFEEAIKLDPNNPDIIDGAAVNDFLRGQYSKAVELEDREHQLAPSHTFINRAFSNYFNHKYADAKQDLLETLKNRSETENIYPAIWLYLTARQLGEDGVKAVKPYMPTFSEPRWPYPILQLYIGTGDYEHALQAAKSDPKDPSKLCELYFYVGEKYLLDGDTRHAREYFKKSVDTGVVEFNEYSMSKRSIEALGEN
jgi:lipoprotein NlpI